MSAGETLMLDNAALARLLRRLAYKEGSFTLRSGRTSDFYLDAKQVTYHPDGVELVGRSVLEEIKEFDVEGVGGLTMGAEAIVTSTIWASIGSDSPLFGFSVRKEPKRHGLGEWIEGRSPDKKRVAIVDDVITTGASVLTAVDRAREKGAIVEVIVGLVDRQEGGRAAFEKAKIPFRALVTLEQIRAAGSSQLQPVYERR